MRMISATLTIALASSALLTMTTLSPSPSIAADDAKPKPASSDPAAKISYHKQVRPILQAHCQGCHQPAKPSGGYVMTAFDRLKKGGESEMPALVPGKPEESNLLEMITPADGKALMPQNKPPLNTVEIDLIRRWIEQGADDDTPANAASAYDMDHPPVYSRPPVIASLDYSADGKLLAIAGFHEALLINPENGERVGRLVGVSERIESVRFSPDGKRLAVTGGLPGRMGEVQIWDVEKRKLLLSQPFTYDTIYGASWSPDGSKLAFGCSDNSVRAIDSKTGQQVLFQGAHSDWTLGAVFSNDGSHLVSVSRDRSVKLTEIATQRFVDNVTSITPGALRGGVTAIARHPKRDEIVIGGSDGVPKLYRIFRLTVRVIGDDSNLIRVFPGLPGRVNSVAVSDDGKRIVAAGGVDNSGEVKVYGYEFDTGLPEDIKAIMAKVSTTRSPEEAAKLSQYETKDVKLISTTPIASASVYSAVFSPDGKQVAAAGGDGSVRLIEAETGKIVRTFSPAPITAPAAIAALAAETAERSTQNETLETEVLPKGAKVVALDVQPKAVELNGPFDYVQIVATAKLESGDAIDATRMIEWGLAANIAEVSRFGLVQPKTDGKTTLKLTFAGLTSEVPVTVGGMSSRAQVDYIKHVTPAMSRLGCNQGTCHGSAQGKNGFKLSLRGYDPIFDVRALTDEHASRRTNVASADTSLMLLKPTGAVPHVGGQLFKPSEAYYQILRSWIADGAKLDLNAPRVKKIEVFPLNPIIQTIGSRQQLRVLATYSDGQVRDVSQEAFLETGNGEVATVSRNGVASALRRGEAPILARYEGSYTATTLTVMGNREGFVWEQPPTYGRIDELAAAKWKRMKIKPSEVCSDAEFIRRLSLDLTGLPPTADEVAAFLADSSDSRAKREALVDRLVGSKEYVEYWTNKWADLLQVNRKFLGPEGSVTFRRWIRDQIAKNAPYDQFARSILTASGSNKENPAASYYKILREPAATMENTTHLFLAIRFNCNKCHDHPFEKWTQDQYFQTAAYFAQYDLKADPSGGGAMIGGSAVESGKPLYEIVSDKTAGEVTHERTGKPSAPRFPYPSADVKSASQASRRVQLSDWITAKSNPYFARSYANRLWGYLFGVGIMEPIDDIRAGNPPTNPELLDHLTQEFIASGFNVQHMLKLICKSRTYQLSFVPNEWNDDDKTNYSRAIARRLPAEVLYDSVYRVTGAVSNIPGVAPGTRASELPDAGVELPSGFLSTFGRPVRESACECERTSGLQLGPVMALVSGPTVGDAIADPKNDISRLVQRETDDAKVVKDLFLRILNRPATVAEVEAGKQAFAELDREHNRLAELLAKREAEFAPISAKLQKEREERIVKTREALASHETAIAPRIAEEEKQRQGKIASAQAALAQQETTVAAKLPEWEKTQGEPVEWVKLSPKAIRAPYNAKFETLPDGSIYVTGESRNGPYNFVAETDLKGITAIRIEAIADDRLPSKGPGRAPDGNFVLTELVVRAAPKGKPREAKPVKLEKPLADFSQEGFNIANAVDAKRNANDPGWAVSPRGGSTHWATFETKDDVGFDGGTVLTIAMHQTYQNVYTLGRFRISAAVKKRPVGLSLPDELSAVLATAPDKRTAAQKSVLLTYFKSLDPEYQKRQKELEASQAPLPTDPKLIALRGELAEAEKPVPVDPRLVQLRADAKISAEQLNARRLTAAQDIAWALINSPAFLFNH